MITVLQHAVVKESFRISEVKIVSTGFSRHQEWGARLLKLLKRGAGDEREASDLVPRDFPLEIRKTLGTRLEKPKWGMMGTCAEREGERWEVVEVVEWFFFSLSQHSLRSHFQ